ncbi:MAG: NAD(P)/FAD-dependent oxidoreductase [Aestuariivirgaceae bacterium]
MVVVGAGAAGIGAGLALARSGVPYIILEASSRVGGRAFTDCDSLGSLFDHGCHWFHSADLNPLRVLADRLGHAYAGRTTRGVRPICVDGRWVDESEREHVNSMIFGMFDEIEAAAGQGRDVPLSEVIDFTGRFGPLRRHWIELLECRAPEEVSVLDAGRYRDSKVNYAVKDGYGRLFEKLSSCLAIRRNSPVTEIETMADSVRIRGDFGEIACAAVILTASLGVLASGAVRLLPEPDHAFAAALDDIRMGTYEKTIIAFDKPVLAAPGAQSFYCDIVDPSESGDLPLNFEIQPFGRPLAISHLAGGSLDRLLAREGEAGLVDLTIAKLVRAFGGDIRRHIVGTLVTSWGSNPFIRGGYAIARPGRAVSRERLIAGDISDRVFLAGEACHPYWYATAHGAYLTGIDRAHRALRAIGREDLPPDPLWLPSPAAAASG